MLDEGTAGASQQPRQLSLKGTVSRPLQGQLPERCQPLERPPQHHPHFTDEQTEGGAPWPGRAHRSCSQHTFIEHRLCARPSEGHGGPQRRITHRLHARGAHSLAGQLVTSKDTHDTVVSVVLEVAQVTMGAQRRGPWPSRGWQGGLPGGGDARRGLQGVSKS